MSKEKEIKNYMGYKEALLEARKEVEGLISRYESIKAKDSYSETFQKARVMGYRDVLYRIGNLIAKYDNEGHNYTALNEINEAADNYVGHPEEVDEGITVSGRRDAFKDGAKWQMKKDFDFFTGQMGLYDPNMEVTDEEKIEALRFAYDLDAYMEGEGPNITDVVNGYYGGLLAQKKKDRTEHLAYPVTDTTKDKIEHYIASTFHTERPEPVLIETVEEGVRLGRQEYRDEMMKDALDGYISVGGKRRLITILDGMKDFKFGEKIKAIILKDK